MKGNSIVVTGKPQEIEADINGVKCSVLKYRAKNENGDTNVNFFLIPVGNNRVIKITLWGSDKEQAVNDKDVSSILSSIKTIQ